MKDPVISHSDPGLHGQAMTVETTEGHQALLSQVRVGLQYLQADRAGGDGGYLPRTPGDKGKKIPTHPNTKKNNANVIILGNKHAFVMD